MPRGDRTGPEGMGAMTGRGAGDCNENLRPGFRVWPRMFGFFGRHLIGHRYSNRRRYLPGRGFFRRRW